MIDRRETARGAHVRRVAVAAAVVVVIAVGAVTAAIAIPEASRESDAFTASAPSGTPSMLDAAPSRVALTPTAHPESGQSFSWLAGDPSHTAGQVQLRKSGEDESRTIDAQATGRVNGDPRQHFSATATGLEAATSYDYRVGQVGGWSPWYTFTTPDPADRDLQFIYYGDAQTGLGSTWSSVVRQAEATAPDAIGSVHAGDLVDDPVDEGEWTDWFAGMGDSAATRNVLAAPGNHEYVDDSLLRAWKASFEYPHNNPAPATAGSLSALADGGTDVARQYAAYFAHWAEIAAETVYYTDYQDVRFITLNASQNVEFLTPPGLPACDDDRCPSHAVGDLWVRFQASWLDGVLADNPSRWSVITLHQPVYSASVGRDEPVLRAHWVPVFEKHNVDLVLMGHDHVYARGYANADAVAPGVTDGPVYVVSNSGAKHYEIAPADANVWTANGATQVRRGSGVTTFQVIDVSSTTLTYRSYLVEKTPDSSSSRPVGAVFDEFVIAKSGDGSKRVSEGPPVSQR